MLEFLTRPAPVWSILIAYVLAILEVRLAIKKRLGEDYRNWIEYCSNQGRRE